MEGVEGELIERLVACADRGVETEGSWYDIAIWVSHFLGGHCLLRVIPDSGREIAPGSVGEKLRETNEVMTRATYFGLIRQRMIELVAQDVNEAFLVRLVRDQIRRELVHLADDGDASERRAATRQRLEAAITDPHAIAFFRAVLVGADTAAAWLPDEVIKARLAEMAGSPILDPMPLEQAVERWAAVEDWDRSVGVQLSDGLIEQWLTAFTIRLTR